MKTFVLLSGIESELYYLYTFKQVFFINSFHQQNTFLNE